MQAQASQDAMFQVSKNMVGGVLIAAAVIPPIMGGLGTAYWGGRLVISLAHTGLLRTFIIATVQSVFGFIMAMVLDESIKKLISNVGIRIPFCITLFSLFTGGTAYAVVALAVKAGLISTTALTLPAVAALVVVPAVVGGVSLCVSGQIQGILVDSRVIRVV